MKKILIIGYLLTSFWFIITVGLSIRSITASSNSFDYLLGEYIGMFLVSTTPLGIVFAYHKFTNKKQETKHAIQ